MKSINPATGEVIREYSEHMAGEAAAIASDVFETWKSWKETGFEKRSELFHKAALVLRNRKEQYARLITSEMGKLITEAEAEVEKCALTCDYYADHAASMLRDDVIPSDATRSYAAFQPLGPVLAVMPWNFPFWQVFRFAAPALMAGNAGLLKHASNVPGCALAIEEVFRDAGFPENLFRTLMIPSPMVGDIIAHPAVAAVTLTGSEPAGAQVASQAGRYLKKCVLELGGSDPFIVLEDADLELAARTAVASRMINQGQTCISAKRFIVVPQVIDEFEMRMTEIFRGLVTGDPLDRTTQVGPMARPDLVDEIERQVKQSVAAGARLVTGGNRIDRPGNYFEPTLLAGVKPGMAAWGEETFGPVAALIEARDEEEAISIANDSPFGLGGCVWTRDLERGERVARRVDSGAVFVNGMTKSDPRLPFGGIKRSGFGRELGTYGITEFVNIKTIWVGQ